MFKWYFHLLHSYGPLAKYIKLRVVDAQECRECFHSPPPKETAIKGSRHASRHVRHARAVMLVGIAYPRWRGKHSRHSRRIHNPQFYVSGTRPIVFMDDASGIYLFPFRRWLYNLWSQKACLHKQLDALLCVWLHDIYNMFSLNQTHWFLKFDDAICINYSRHICLLWYISLRIILVPCV